MTGEGVTGRSASPSGGEVEERHRHLALGTERTALHIQARQFLSLPTFLFRGHHSQSPRRNTFDLVLVLDAPPRLEVASVCVSSLS